MRPSTPHWTGVTATGGLLGLSRLSDNSFFWHLRTGQWMLDHHTVPRGDLYSWSVPGHPWIAQSWLAELCYALVDRVAGGVGIRLLTGLLGAVIGCVLWRLAYRLTHREWTATLIALPAMACSAQTWVSRPLMFGAVALLALVWTVELPDSLLGRHPLVTVPVLLWLWANVHGTWVLGLGYLGLTVLATRRWRLAVAGGIGVAVCLVNPYGWRLLWFPFGLIQRGDILRNVDEWKSPDMRSWLGLWLAVWTVLFVAVLARGRRRPGAGDLLVALPFLVAGYWAQRNTLLLPLVGLPVAARALASPPRSTSPAPAAPSARSARSTAGRPGALPATVALGLVAAVIGGVVMAEPTYDLSGYPVAAMADAQRAGLLGRRLLTTDGWAGYVISRYWPGQRVFTDDRYDMYPPDLIRRYLDVSHGNADWSMVLDQYDVDVVVWPAGGTLTSFLALTPGWTRVYGDRVAAVYAREADVA